MIRRGLGKPVDELLSGAVEVADDILLPIELDHGKAGGQRRLLRAVRGGEKDALLLVPDAAAFHILPLAEDRRQRIAVRHAFADRHEIRNHPESESRAVQRVAKPRHHFVKDEQRSLPGRTGGAGPSENPERVWYRAHFQDDGRDLAGMFREHPLHAWHVIKCERNAKFLDFVRYPGVDQRLADEPIMDAEERRRGIVADQRATGDRPSQPYGGRVAIRAVFAKLCHLEIRKQTGDASANPTSRRVGREQGLSFADRRNRRVIDDIFRMANQHVVDPHTPVHIFLAVQCPHPPAFAADKCVRRRNRQTDRRPSNRCERRRESPDARAH